MKGIPVLMYHALEDINHPACSRGAGEQVYVLNTTQFKKHLELLKISGCRTFLLHDVDRLPNLPEAGLIITFDDGHVSNNTLALSMLCEFAFKADFFITTGWIGTQNHMNCFQIRELSDAGMGVGSHGVSHQYFQQMSNAEIREELRVSKTILEDITGKEIDTFSAPGGRLTSEVVNIARESGYRFICGSRPGYYAAGDDIIPRFDITPGNHSILTDLIAKKRGRFYRQLIRYESLYVAKKILGNSMYDRLRNSLLKAD